MSVADLTRKALRASPALRAIADTPIAQQVIQTQRATRVLMPAGRFTARQLRRGSVGRYQLHASGMHVHIRHRTRDLDILSEIFSAGSYEPPAQVAALLDGPVRVADLGGNVGLFGAFALHRWQVTALRSYEPDPANARLLTATAEPYEEWEVIEAAVSNAAGTMRFAAGMFSESRAACPGEEAITVPVVDLFAEPGADLVKIDIEGGEWPILGDPRFRRPPARVVVMEWHARGCPAPNPAAHAGRLLTAAGFPLQHHGAACASNGLLWAWRDGSRARAAVAAV
jgi:FkbM family methyltransferase